jgi:Lrp/AsnC family leucine-responsive transcriptional regulator
VAGYEDLNELDRRIVDRLVEDGRVSYRQLGDEIGLSANATADRVKALVKRGVITGFTALLGDGTGRRPLEAIIDLRLRSNAERSKFEEHVRSLPAIADAVHLTGTFDYQLKIACRNAEEIDHTIATLKDQGGVTETRTRVVLRRVV